MFYGNTNGTKRTLLCSAIYYNILHFKELVVIIIPKNSEVRLNLGNLTGEVVRISNNKLKVVKIESDNLVELLKMASSVSLSDYDTFELLIKLQNS